MKNIDIFMYIFQVRNNYLIFYLEKDIIIIKKKGLHHELRNRWAIIQRVRPFVEKGQRGSQQALTEQKYYIQRIHRNVALAPGLYIFINKLISFLSHIIHICMVVSIHLLSALINGYLALLSLLSLIICHCLWSLCAPIQGFLLLQNLRTFK